MPSFRFTLVLSVAVWMAGPMGAAQAYSRLFDHAHWLDRERPRLGAEDPPEGFQPRLSAESGVLCVKQCPNDQLPCDPPFFKVADGRCAEQWR